MVSRPVTTCSTALLASCPGRSSRREVSWPPWLAGGSANALGWSIGLTAAGLFSVGATLSLFTGRHAVHSGARMLALGGLAGGVTYVLGHLLGTVVG